MSRLVRYGNRDALLQVDNLDNLQFDWESKQYVLTTHVIEGLLA